LLLMPLLSFVDLFATAGRALTDWGRRLQQQPGASVSTIFTFPAKVPATSVERRVMLPQPQRRVHSLVTGSLREQLGSCGVPLEACLFTGGGLAHE